MIHTVPSLPCATALEPDQSSICEICEEEHSASYDLSYGRGQHVAICSAVLAVTPAVRFELGEPARWFDPSSLTVSA